jgi:hypothetical protein
MAPLERTIRTSMKPLNTFYITRLHQYYDVTEQDDQHLDELP